ncbi:MAG: hypothetical protein KBS52_06740 [Clostridiales bacterium]|nr:hypothetical protein [Candidatus Equinaster intestinalis]
MNEVENEVVYLGVNEQASPIEKGAANIFKYNAGIAHLRLVLLLFVSINVFGVAGGVIGNFIEVVSGFAMIAYFIISGFLILYDDKGRNGRITRTIGRSALTFIILGAVYLGLNFIFYYIGGVNIFTMYNYATKRFWFNLLVLNIWPYNIGSLIWFVEAYLFAYIFIYIVNKLKLMKLDWLFFIIFAVIGFATSEFSAFIPFKFFGYPYLPHGVITMALPYIFLGSFLRRKIASFAKLDNIYYVLIGILSMVLCFAEGFVLSKYGKLYTTHTFIGVSILAFCVAVIAIKPDIVVSPTEVYYQDAMADPNGPSYIEVHFPSYFLWMYYLMHPVSVGLMTAAAYISPKVFAIAQDWIWIINYAVCVGLAMLIGLIIDVFVRRKANKKPRRKYKH